MTNRAFYVHKFVQCLLLCFTSLPSPAQTQLDQLQKALPSMMDSTGTPGMSIAVIENGKVTWAGGLGFIDKNSRERVSGETIFRGASLGKPIFAYSVLQLSETGKLSLDTPLVHYVPQTYLETTFLKAPLSDDQIRLITARMVLNHASGLPNWRSPDKPLTTMFAPGSRYSYSGEGYYLLQHVVEYLVKEPIESYMQRTVFEPLGMNHTSYAYHPADSVRYAHAHDMTGKYVANEQEPVNVAHTLYTTADDYARFIIASTMTQRTSKKLVDSQVNTDICQPGRVSWGLGLALQHTANGDLFCQWAKSPTASGYIIGSADKKMAVVYFVNIANQGLRMAERIVKLSLDYEDPLFSCFGVRPYNAKQ